MDIIAHRGFADEYPSNTSYAAVNSGLNADIIEIDVRQTKDGVFIVFHNPTIQVDDNTYDISELTITDLNNLLGDDENMKRRAPKLSTVMSSTESPFLLDLKGELSISNLLSEIKKYENKILIQSFNTEHTEKLNSLSDYSIGLLVPTEDMLGMIGVWSQSIHQPTEAIERVSNNDGEFIAVAIEHCSKENVQKAHENDLDIYVWTIRSQDQYEKVTELDIDGVITNSKEYVV